MSESLHAKCPACGDDITQLFPARLVVGNRRVWRHDCGSSFSADFLLDQYGIDVGDLEVAS